MKKIYAAAISAHDGKGRVDEKSMARLLERNIAHGVSGFFLLGSMGEGPVMPEKAADELVRVSCQIVGGRAATLAGLNTVGLEKALRRMEALSKTGVDHYVVHSPGLQDRVACPVKYLLSVADHADRDIYIYHLPTIGGLQMSAAQFRDVVGHPRVRGVKNSSGDMFLRKELLMLKDEVGFELFEGQEWSIDEALIVGCDGGLAGLVTLASKPMVAIAKAVDRGDIGEAVRLQRVLIDVFHGVYGPRVTNVVNGHKHALWRLGLLDNTETLYHLEPMTEADKLRVDACLEKHRGLLD